MECFFEGWCEKGKKISKRRELIWCKTGEVQCTFASSKQTRWHETYYANNLPGALRVPGSAGHTAFKTLKLSVPQSQPPSTDVPIHGLSRFKIRS